MPEERRRSLLERLFREMLDDLLGGRVLAFDTQAAVAAGVLGAERRAQGQPVEIRDLLIAGIATSRSAAVATLNLKHFHDLCDVRNPWNEA